MAIVPYLKKTHLRILFYLMIKKTAPLVKVFEAARTRDYKYIRELETLGLIETHRSSLYEPYVLVSLTKKGEILTQKLMNISQMIY